MGAYAALLSLSHILERIFILDQYPLLLDKEKLVYLYGNVTALLKFLEDYSSNYRGVVNPLETRIIDTAYQVEDMVEAQLLTKPSAFQKMMRWFHSSNSSQEMVECQEFHKALQDFTSISEEAMNHQAQSIPPPYFSDSGSSSSTIASNDMNIMVGLDDNFMAIKEQMYQQSSTFHVIPIYGMGGIGKTTLATRLYEDSINMQWYDRRIWIVVSQDYSLRKIILGILKSLKMPINEKRTDAELAQIVYQELFGRRYLIVADDVWSEEAWDILNRVLPKDTVGSQVLVTTRLKSVSTYVGSSSSSPQEIKFLSEEQSWRLLVNRVFGEEACPSQLENIGMKIVKRCRGLPLMIVVVAGLLKDNITEAYWRRTLNMISSSARSDMVEHCSKVLSLSYDHLPLYLKPCFLYATAFPEDYEVRADRLVCLWMAEGFVREIGSKCLEEVAEGYLNDLVGRSLLIGSKNRYSGEIEAVKVHDSLRNVGILKAREGRFYHDGASWRSEDKERRVTSHNFQFDDFSRYQGTTIRTYLGTGKPLYFGDSFENHRFLRILHSREEEFKLDPRRMVLVRYLSIDHYTCPPRLLHKFRNLQTLDISVSYLYRKRVTLKIWKMPFLRQVKIPEGLHLEQPAPFEIVKETNLQTLSVARNLKITPEVIKMLANLRKLDLHYEDVGFWGRRQLRLNNLVHLQKLEELIIVDQAQIDWENIWSSGVKLPISLKKLELRCTNVPWEYINKVGLILPNLEYLMIAGQWLENLSMGFEYLMMAGGRSLEWNPIEGGFLKLKCLQLWGVDLKHWGAERIHFPSLEFLVIKRLGLYQQVIPSGIGEIDALKLIELHDCEPSLVASAKQIQADQQDMGNEGIQVIVRESDGFARRKRRRMNRTRIQYSF